MKRAVDDEGRRAAARLLRSFLAKEVSGHQLEDQWPRSDDPALKEIARVVWRLYDDIWDDMYRPSTGGDELLRRCIDFLRDGPREYVWPIPSPWYRLAVLPLNLVTLGHAERFLGRKYRLPDHWPFATQQEREGAREGDAGEQVNPR